MKTPKEAREYAVLQVDGLIQNARTILATQAELNHFPMGYTRLREILTEAAHENQIILNEVRKGVTP